MYTDHSLNSGGTKTFSYTNDTPYRVYLGDNLLLGLAGSNYSYYSFNIGDLEVFTIAPSEEEVSSVPLPAALPLMSSALGLFGLGALHRRNKA